MRLLSLDSNDHFSLTEHPHDKLPPYAILSHTWGPDSDEVSFADIQNGCGQEKNGYQKLRFCGEQAKRHGIEYFWIDTCCINKRSSAELNEAINSMFSWYNTADVCYVYLADVALHQDPSNNGSYSDEITRSWEPAFRQSRWFTRGWTLQELLAPETLLFFSKDWEQLGSKSTLIELIHEITDIPTDALSNHPLNQFTIAERMHWTEHRQTRKVEDKAYCLFGIFDVSMPMIYGEGEHAFRRLIREIAELQEVITIPSDPGTGQTPSPAAERRGVLLNSLRFEGMGSRPLYIAGAFSTTCDWFVRHPTYLAWNDPGQISPPGNFLWITGKPGTGKSTLMKFAHAHAQRTKKDGELVVSFFFSAIGHALERSTLGMYRAILYEILQKLPDLQVLLDEMPPFSKPNNEYPNWSITMLQQVLSAAILRLGRRSLKCFIDALDECDNEQIRGMVDFFEAFRSRANDTEGQLHVCFASRHYPYINIRYGQKIILEDEHGHAEDLAKYVRRRLRAGTGKRAEDISVQVQEKANGVFAWAVLVVDILNRVYRQGRIFDVQKRLGELPYELRKLFQEIIDRDSVNKNALLLCLQWISFARRPLRQEEFYYAMTAGLSPEPLNSDEWDPLHITADDYNRCVVESSRGLAELTKSKTPTVQFVHESVRDFLIKENGLRALWTEGHTGDIVSLSHDRLKDCCQVYLSAAVSAYIPDNEPPPKPFSKAGKELRQKLGSKFPFLAYAVQNVFHHANEAAKEVLQLDFVKDFCLKSWIIVSNLLQPENVGCYSTEVTHAYIFAGNNFARLIKATRPEETNLQIPRELYQYPLFAAIANDHRDAARALLRVWNSDQIEDTISSIDFGAKFTLSSYQSPLTWALANGLETLASSLVAYEVISTWTTADGQTRVSKHPISDWDKEDVHGWTAFGLAVSCGYEKIVMIMMDRGADINSFHRGYGSVLQVASNIGHVGLVQMLLRHGANVDAKGGPYGNALRAAEIGGHNEVVKILLDVGASLAEAVDVNKGNLEYSVVQIADKNTNIMNYEISVPAIATDSGYSSMNKLAHGRVNRQAEDDASVYSVDSFVDIHTQDRLIDNFIERLLADLDLVQFSDEQFETDHNELDALFLDFALRLGYDDTSSDHLEIAKFVRKHRRGLTTKLRDSQYRKPDESTNMLFDDAESLRNSEEENHDGELVGTDGPPISAAEKVRTWQISHSSEWSNNDVGDSDYYLGQTTSRLTTFDTHTDVVCDSFAYRWLLATMRNRFMLMNGAPHILLEIRQILTTELPKPQRMSKRLPVPEYCAVFEVSWSLRSFLDSQVPDWRDSGIGQILTLTGGSINAQACTCLAYMQQTWPLSGTTLLGALDEMLLNGTVAERFQAGHLTLSAYEEDPYLRVEAAGARGAVVELGEQLCWLSSALRSAALNQGIQCCTPALVSAEPSRDWEPKATRSSSVMETRRCPTELKFFRITHQYMLAEPDKPVYSSNGTCWHALFRKATLVCGFPISIRRSPSLGLEIPLTIAGDLIGVCRVTHFNGISSLKSPSALLYPTKQLLGTVLWHLEVAQDDDMIMYPNCWKSLPEWERPAETYERHIVGWSQGTVNLAGTTACKYDVQPVVARPVGLGHAFHRSALNSTFTLSSEDPFRVPQEYYHDVHRQTPLPSIMRSLRSRSVCFWDVAAKRGWLVDGWAALAHIIRASVRSDEELPTDLMPAEPPNFEEPPDPHKLGASGDWVCNPLNWNKILLRYQRKGDWVVETFEDRATQLYELLDQVFCYQEIHRSALKCSSRARLESWDFHSMTWRRQEKQKPVLVKIAARGMGWVDLLRDAKIPTLCGSNFGELMQPGEAAQLCARWRALPTLSHYLAAPIHVLQNISMRAGGDDGRRPRRLTKCLNWIALGPLFKCCGCQDESVCNQHVQVLLQRKLNPRWNPDNVCELPITCLPEDGIVVFGHNYIQDWHWPEYGQPQKGGAQLFAVEEDISEGDSSTDESAPEEIVNSVPSQPLTSPPTSMATINSSGLHTLPRQKSFGNSIISGSGHTQLGDRTIHNTVTNNSYYGTHAGAPRDISVAQANTNIFGTPLLESGPDCAADPDLEGGEHNA